MGRFFFGFAALLFFFSAVNVTVIPKPEAWGFVMLAIGLAIDGMNWTIWRKSAA